MDNGVARFNNGRNSTGIDEDFIDYFSAEDGLCGKTVADIVEDQDGLLWFGTHSDMCRYDLRSKTNNDKETFMAFERQDSVPKLGWGWKNVKTDRNGDLWVNTHHGIFRYQNGEFNEFVVPTTKANTASFCNTPGKVAMDLVDSRGGIWFGTDGDGAYSYDPSAERQGLKAFTHFTKEDGLSSSNVTGIIEDEKGDIWFTCVQSLDERLEDGGLCRLNVDKNGQVNSESKFTKFPEFEGLHGNNIHTSYVDGTGNLWIGATGVGVYRYSTNKGDEVEEKEKFTLFKEPKGVDLTPTGYTTGLQSILEDSKGRLWCGFSGGLFKLENHLAEEAATASFVNVRKDGPWN